MALHWKDRPDTKLAYHSWRITTLCRDVLTAARQAQELISKGSELTSSQQVQALIQTATKEAHALSIQIDEVNLLLNGLRDVVTPLPPNELNSARKTLSFACEYLLHREAQGVLLSSPRTKNAAIGIFQTFRRQRMTYFKYYLKRSPRQGLPSESSTANSFSVFTHSPLRCLISSGL